MPPPDGEHGKERDDISGGDPPAMSQPVCDRSRFWKKRAESDASRGTEPDNRAAKTDRVSEKTPVITTLLQGERGERNVVERGRQQAEPERRLPRRNWQFFNRHH